MRVWFQHITLYFLCLRPSTFSRSRTNGGGWWFLRGNGSGIFFPSTKLIWRQSFPTFFLIPKHVWAIVETSESPRATTCFPFFLFWKKKEKVLWNKFWNAKKNGLGFVVDLTNTKHTWKNGKNKKNKMKKRKTDDLRVTDGRLLLSANTFCVTADQRWRFEPSCSRIYPAKRNEKTLGHKNTPYETCTRCWIESAATEKRRILGWKNDLKRAGLLA